MTDLFENYTPPWMNDELTMLRDAARKFFMTELAPQQERWEANGIVDRDAWTKTGAEGFLLAEMPVEYGGAGGDYRHETVIMEEQLSSGASGLGTQVHSQIVAPYFLHYGNEEQRQRWLPGMAAGTKVGAIAMTEPNTGSDLQSIRTTAIRDGDEFVVNGSKTYIGNGQRCDLVIVVAKTDPSEGAKGISLIVIEDGTEGFSKGRNLKKLGQAAADTSELFFEDCRVPAENLVGDPASGNRVIFPR